jgi:hypothetical protein
MHSCSHCGKTGKTVKGLCLPCYYRQKKTGSLEYQRKGKTTPCTVEGCDGHAVSGGLCAKHYGRMRRHGHLEQTRPEDWGARNDHPLTPQWNWLHHKKGVQLLADEWKTDFSRFTKDVGVQPSPAHKLKRKDPNRLIGPDNFVWAAPEYPRQPGETQREANNRAERERRRDQPDKFRDLHLRKKYAGLTQAGAAAMSERQNHRCAICEEAEGTVIKGKVIALAVDHDRETGAIRGLLCQLCNRGIGLLRHKTSVLESAIRYLQNPPGEILARVPVKRRGPRQLRDIDSSLDKDAILPQT